MAIRLQTAQRQRGAESLLGRMVGQDPVMPRFRVAKGYVQGFLAVSARGGESFVRLVKTMPKRAG